MLHVDGVTVRYGGGDAIAVDQLSFSVSAGERIALIGPSGAGKSTILRLASGLTRPTVGTVKILGVDSHELGRRTNRTVRSKIGIIGQDFSLTGPLRVASNVASGRLGQWSAIRSLVSLVRPGPIDEITAALDQVGIANKIWERTDQLSGGQQQRTAIARTLFQEPELLLADEPVSALDPARSDSVMVVLTKQVDSTPNKTMITSMHDAPLALAHCDRVLGMRDGRMQFDLPAAQVTTELLDKLYALDNAV